MGCNFFMDLSIDKLLAKMETELHQARRSDKEENVREKIYSIKILCELILDEKVGSSEDLVSSRPQEVYQPAASLTIQPMAVNQQKKLQTDDGANGDSLFDF